MNKTHRHIYKCQYKSVNIGEWGKKKGGIHWGVINAEENVLHIYIKIYLYTIAENLSQFC